MSNTIFTVIGLLQSKGASMMNSTDETILIPLSTLYGMMSRSLTTTGQHTVSTIALQVTDKDNISQVKEDITILLQDRHKIALGDENDFTVSSMDELISNITSSTESMTLLLGAIAGISLLVGGIGVMNIMLVSVLERRKEIGIRKALEARQRDIWGQFLIDSALLTFTGGIIGVTIGWGGSYLVNYTGTMTTVVTADVVWDNIRKDVYRVAGHKCDVCGYQGKLFCHEVWMYDDVKHIQKLSGFEALCELCHSVKHIGLAGLRAEAGELDYNRIVRHFRSVNGCSYEDFILAREIAFGVWADRSDYKMFVYLD
jgi:hypothetical protein